MMSPSIATLRMARTQHLIEGVGFVSDLPRIFAFSRAAA
jgi:hypothetical protein